MSTVISERLTHVCQSTPTILCIDDDPDVSAAIERRLSQYDVHLIRAFHGMHGYAEALAHKPDVIVMDVRMPRGDGATILECLRRNRQTAVIPVIVLTGIRDRRLRHHLLELGADAFLQKPLPLDELTRTLSRFVELRKREDANATNQDANHEA
jgi:DNA-binding response OmpR family regulator